MEWNAKLDWENMDSFSSKAMASAKKATDWEVQDDEMDIDAGFFNLFGVVGGINGSPEMGNNSSSKSSLSASTESSIRCGNRIVNFTLEAGVFSGNMSQRKELVRGEVNSPSLDPLVGSDDPFTGLKLGKRTYCDSTCAVSSSKTMVNPVSSVSGVKKNQSPCQNVTTRCQVDGCNLDLSSAKEYYRKHRICVNHSKFPKVVIGGLERRFCQQCSRLHSLPEFDENKRSCRKRLSDHNTRRRKQQQGTTQFNSTGASPSFHDGRKDLNFTLNSDLLFHARPSSNTWEDVCTSIYTSTKFKDEKARGFVGQPCSPGIQLSHRLLSSMSTTTEIQDQGTKESASSSFKNAELDFPRALSLLSNNSWGSTEHDFTVRDNPVNAYCSTLPRHGTGSFSQVLPPPSLSEYWQVDQQFDSCMNASTVAKSTKASSHFQETQLAKESYQTRD